MFYFDSFVFILPIVVFVNSFIFFVAIISDKSYFVYLNICIQTVIIFSFFSILPFSSKHFINVFISYYSKFRFKNDSYNPIDFYIKGTVSELVRRFACFISLGMGSSLNSLLTKFSNFIIIIVFNYSKTNIVIERNEL